MGWIKEKKNTNLILEDYILSSRIHDCYELPHMVIEKILDTEGDYFAVRMQATPAFLKQGKVVKGIQRRIISAVKNSVLGHCFTGYDMKDTIVSINQSSDKYSANLFNVRCLEQHLDNTSGSAVRIFSGKMPNGYCKLAARLEEKAAVVYVHKSALYLAAFDMLEAFIPSESDRGWLVDEMQRIAEYQAEVHF
ncbi:MAG: hypothetical protein V1734_00590 [Nanoarchaeota archaeon]